MQGSRQRVTSSLALLNRRRLIQATIPYHTAETKRLYRCCVCTYIYIYSAHLLSEEWRVRPCIDRCRLSSRGLQCRTLVLGCAQKNIELHSSVINRVAHEDNRPLAVTCPSTSSTEAISKPNSVAGTLQVSDGAGNK